MDFSKKLAENSKNIYVDSFDEDNVLFAVKLDGATPHRNALGALILDFNQVETLRASLDYLFDINLNALELNKPLISALQDLSHILDTVNIQRNG